MFARSVLSAALAGSRAVHGRIVAVDLRCAIAESAACASRWYWLSCAAFRMMVISFCVGQWKLRSAANSGETLGNTCTTKSWYTTKV